MIMTNENVSLSRRGVIIAAGAAALVLAGCAGSNYGAAKMAQVHCTGVNACKGTSDCKTAENACKGQNVCKGHGFLNMSAEQCNAKGGQIATM
ncbi:MAG: hypothetical protein COZ24_11095 [Hydrogenophilales bacterium CG_4_10_14_3_um_filter_63_21]|nr:MAG: hypothetical protein COZ24_11095 [Hydrogenophilales bacterium CG_4_10_14_3_um_filter_63_21]